MPRPLFTPGKDPVTIVQEAGWAPGPVWPGAENLAPTGIQSPDRPASSQSLYRLSYRPTFMLNVPDIFKNCSYAISHESIYNRSYPTKLGPAHFAALMCFFPRFNTTKTASTYNLGYSVYHTNKYNNYVAPS
jgi:hypothetical protein